MTQRTRVVSYGLGPIGLAAADLALGKRNIELVGAIDIDPKKQGADVGTLLGRDPIGVAVEADADAALARLKPDVALHCTSSFIPVVIDQLIGCARAGVNVVSSCEELLVPDLQHPDLAGRIDAAAREGGATILGTGVNPGFVMDFMAAIGSAVVADVSSVRCVRVVDAGTRRLPLQRKVGASMTVEEFREQEKTGRFGHIGMRESVALVGRALDLGLDEITQSLEPVVATERHQTPHLVVEAGQVAGIRNIGTGTRAGEQVVELDLSMYVGAPDPRDEVHLSGDPDLSVRFEGGVPGDSATVAVLVNNLRQVVDAAPGLRTVLDLPPPRLLR